jgi:predicted Zn-dependent protease
MTLSLDEASALATRVVTECSGDEVEVLVMAGSEALTRFANNRIHQNVAVDDAVVNVRVVVGKRQGGASTNRLDTRCIEAACEAAYEAAVNAPEDPTFAGLPDAHEWMPASRARESAKTFGPGKRAEAVRELIAASADAEGGPLTAAGKVEVADNVIAIASSRGVEAYAEVTEFAATVLSMGPGAGTGWASFSGAGPEGFDPAAMGARAAELAVAGADAGRLEPGEYTVVLGPEAVGEMLSMLAYTGLSAKALAEGRSFLSDRLGEQVMSHQVTIADDAMAPDATGLTFDFEGQPKKRVEFVANGVAGGVVTDSYWAARLGMDNTGHALPAPNAFGPYPLDLGMEAGDASFDELISQVDRGVYVNRFWYVNVADPVKVELTGMTRDGTFLIENGKITTPVKNQRFTQSAVEALSHVRAVGRDRQLVGDRGSGVLVPALLLDKFDFTGQTE